MCDVTLLVITGTSVWMWCPGCEDTHRIVIGDDKWTWDSSETAPTFAPSILVEYGDGRRCHSFIEHGVWQYLNDCTHSLASQHVPMVEVPGWMQHVEDLL
jgi:hypothetical protein